MGISLWCLLALSGRIQDSRAEDALLQELSTSARDIQRLMELGNVTEAEHALIRMKEALAKLRVRQGEESKEVKMFSASIAELERSLSDAKSTAE